MTPSASMSTVDHLIAEGDDLDALVRDLPASEWTRPTPAAGWTIAHQIGHLAWTDEVSVAAATDPTEFSHVLAQAAADPLHFTDTTAGDRAGWPAAACRSRGS